MTKVEVRYCIFCGGKIDESKGYLTYFVRGIRYEYHIHHRPNNIPN